MPPCAVDYRFSVEAQEIRDKMTGFELSEKEFKEIYARRVLGREEFEHAVAQGSMGQPLSSNEILKLALNAELSEGAIQDILGHERYAEYQRSQDNRYRQLKRAAAQGGLAPDWVQRIYDGQRASEENAKAVRDNPNLSEDQKESMLQDSARLRQEQVRLWLGDDLARKLQPVLASPP
jgi:hypothetical protein